MESKVEAIRELGYAHHVYAQGSEFSDFCRIHDFEHELRNVLLKYALIIENNIKRIFISYLNDQCKSPDFLLDISNYNTALNERRNNGAIQTIKKIIELLDNAHSKPIMRKRRQNLPVPYWILVNEMTLNQTLKTIDNLRDEDKNNILQNILHELTECTSLNVLEKANKTDEQIAFEQDHLKFLGIMLRYIGEFRNLLAHNQPIYNYNVSNTSLSTYPLLEHVAPPVKFESKRSKEEQRQRQNGKLMGFVKRFFGEDAFSSHSVDVNIDLSFIIYTIGKIVCHIRSTNEFDYGKDIREVYMKYHVLIGFQPFHRPSPESLRNLSSDLTHLDSVDDCVRDLILRLEAGRPYKRSLKSLTKSINDCKKRLAEDLNSVRTESMRSNYPLFPQGRVYKLFTNIDATFLDSL